VSGADQVDLSVDKHLEALRFKVTTLTALRLQGIGELKDLRWGGNAFETQTRNIQRYFLYNIT
jgi:hypothetical protein